MTTKAQRRAAEIEQLRLQVARATELIWTLMETLPDDANLGTHRAIRNHVTRTLHDVQAFVARENARREGRP